VRPARDNAALRKYNLRYYDAYCCIARRLQPFYGPLPPKNRANSGEQMNPRLARGLPLVPGQLQWPIGGDGAGTANPGPPPGPVPPGIAQLSQHAATPHRRKSSSLRPPARRLTRPRVRRPAFVGALKDHPPADGEYGNRTLCDRPGHGLQPDRASASRTALLRSGGSPQALRGSIG
jgi:hypothetical protein